MYGQNPGEFREKVVFYRKGELVSTGDGGFIAGKNTMVEAFTASARVVPDRTYSNFENNRLQLVVPYKVTIRYSDSRIPQADMIVRWRGSDYRVLEPGLYDPYRRYLELRIIRAE